MSILGRGVYSITEAARLASLKPGRVRAWFDPTLMEGKPSRGFFESDYPAVDGDRAISFLDLIEVYIVGRLREATKPVSLQHIRKVHEMLSRETNEPHPFCSRDIRTGYGKIFTRRLSAGPDGAFIEALTSQAYINEAILPFLEKIEYHHLTDLANLWDIAEGIVVDPSRCFGKPVVDEVGITTRVLASAYSANGRDMLRVADWYEIEPRHVEAAVRFEGRYAA